MAELNQRPPAGLHDRIDVPRVLRALRRRAAVPGAACSPDEATLADASHLLDAIDDLVALGWPRFYSARLDRPRQR